MFKLSIVIVCIAIFGSAMCEAELKEEIVKGRADEIAKWAANKLPEYAGLKGSLFVQDVQSIAKSQEKEKFNFDLTVNYGVVGEETSVRFFLFPLFIKMN